MENATFWQSVLMLLIGILQQVVGLFIWEKKQGKVDSPPQNSDNIQQ